MKHTLLCVLFLYWAPLFFAQEITGDWGGKLSVKGPELRLVFHIASTADGYTSTMDSPDQGVKGIPVGTTTFANSQLTLAIPVAGIEYTGTLNADQTITGVFKQAGQTFDLIMSHDGAKNTTLVRPQEPKAPFPYYTEDVVFKNAGANIQLAGTLTLPKQKGKFPVVILITGSGPQDRNESLLGHQPFAVIADYLTRNGIGVLRFDDRGVGQSTGNFSGATTMDFATDVEAALAYLETRREVDKKHIGLVGHSEGGIIAPLVASRNPKKVAYIVLLAGTGIRGAELLLMQQELISRANGEPEDEIAQTTKINRGTFDIVLANEDYAVVKEKMQAYLQEELASVPDSLKEGESDEAIIEGVIAQINSPWMLQFLRYDPTVALKKVTCPVLALNGSKDLQVPPKEDLAAIGEALKAGGNTHVTLVELDGLNHLFQECTTGSPTEYATIEQTFSPKALAVLTEWIQGQVK